MNSKFALVLATFVTALGGLSTLVSEAEARNLAAVAPVASCASLRQFDLQLADYPTQITDTRESEGFCRVQGYVSPQIKFEVRLPLTGWTQRYLQTGCGGLCGQLSIRAPQRACPALLRGEFVTASTNMGHDGQGGVWGASDQQLRVDFGYRAVHATALVAKGLIHQFYGQPAKFSYFSGCSDGGREGLMEAQRYPGDFDGIAAGAPAMNFQVQNSFHHAWMALSSDPGLRNPVLTAADMPVLHMAALSACDDMDGVSDGLISSPLMCRFDPRAAVCKTGEGKGCLTPAAAEAAARIYAGANDAEGHRFEVAGLMPGSELAWPGVGVVPDPNARNGPPIPAGLANIPGSAMFASDSVHWLAFPKALASEWKLTDFRFDVATFDALRPMHAIYDSTDPDLGNFASHGGKLLIWHGWSDQHISPGNTVAYTQAVQDVMGSAKANAFLRTFLIPGMYHCGSGDGLTSVDVLSPLMAWVEDDQAPASIVASRSDADAGLGKGRTIFAWPYTSVLKRNSDANLPANWAKGPATGPQKLYASWYGADFYRSGYAQECEFEGQQYVCRPAS